MTRAGVLNAMRLAKLAVEETGIGNVEDTPKITSPPRWYSIT